MNGDVPHHDHRSAGGDDAAFAPIDLHLRLGELRDALVEVAAAGQWLDAFLLATAMGQIVEDDLHGSRGAFDRIAEHLDSGRAVVHQMALTAATLVRAIHRRIPRQRRLVPHREELLSLSVALAHACLAPGVDETTARDLRRRIGVLADPIPALDRVDQRAMRLPSCFRSFDQHPRDVVRLVAEYTRTTPVATPILVVGVRTSGSYLGSLAAAALSLQGVEDVDLITLRPGERLDRFQRRAVDVVKERGTVLILDDPPVSGDAIRRVARELERCGMAPEHIVLLVGTDDAMGRLPSVLDPFRRHVLTTEEWELRRRLRPDVVAAEVTAVVSDDWDFAEVEALPFQEASDGLRAHASVWLKATLRDGPDHSEPVLVRAQSVGIGLFGRHAVAIACRLGAIVPEVVGFRDGVMFEVIRSPAGLTTTFRRPGAELVGDYATARHRALRTADDRSMQVRGHQAVWEVASELIGNATGRLDVALRLPFVNPAIRAILRVDSPSIIDGRTYGNVWIDTANGLQKLESAEGAFSNRDLACYDSAFDVVTALGLGSAPGELHAARTRFEANMGEAVGAARWLLLRLVHLWDQRRAGSLCLDEWGPEVTCAISDFLAETVLDVPQPVTGSWACLDIDGVVETAVLGASAPGRAGATALRALAAHGFRVALVTGRGCRDVQNRIESWRLPGAVVEYGAGLILRGQEDPVDLRDDRGRRAMTAVRASLGELDGVTVAETHSLAVRAHTRSNSGRRLGPLTDSAARRVVDSAGGSGVVTVVQGDDQTDFIPIGVSKAEGIRRLLEHLDPDGARGSLPLALAVGDGPADVGMLALAEFAMMPRHSAALAEAAGLIASRRSYQAGLLDAVGRLIGHQPGTCPLCTARLSNADDLILRFLSFREAGPAGIATRAASTCWRARRFVRQSSTAHNQQLIGGRSA